MTDEQIVKRLADLPLIVRGSQDEVFKSVRELQELARRRATQSPEPPSADAETVAKEIAEELDRLALLHLTYGDKPLDTDEIAPVVEAVKPFVAAALTTAQVKQREVDAGIAEHHCAVDCDGPDCGVVIARQIRAGGK